MTVRRRSIGLLVLLLAAGAAVAGALAQSSSGDDSRDARRITDALAIRPGSTVGEIGGGNGALAIAIALVVGDAGRVFVTELGEDRVASLTRAIERAGAKNVTVLAADPAKANLEAGCCDALYMRNVYHHFDDPRAMNASLFEALRPGGMLGVMDFTPPGEPARSPRERDADGQHGVVAETVADELKQAGFDVVSTESGNGREVFVVARKPRPE
jgi:ubiquinone/menaquinone biosynthesis C-methylase UbiE